LVKKRRGVKMRKVLVVLMIVAFAAGIALISTDTVLAAKAPEKKSEPASTPAPAAKPAEEAKVVCKFKNKDDMQAFEQLYVAKQATFGRMGVLQAYFSMEQNNLTEIDKQLEEKFKFKMDTDKMYDLNRDNMEIREVGNIPQQPAPAQQ